MPLKTKFGGGILQFTPFGKISSETIEKKISDDAFRLFIPGVPLPAIEIKYPIIQTVRLIISILIAVVISYFIMTQAVQDTFSQQILDRYLPLPTQQIQDTESGNLFDRFRNTIEGTIDAVANSPEYLETLFWRQFWFNILVGGGFLGFSFRAIFFYILITILYSNSRSDWKGSERFFNLQRVGLSQIGKRYFENLLENLDQLVSTRRITPEIANRIKELSTYPAKRKKFSEEEIDILMIR